MHAFFLSIGASLINKKRLHSYDAKGTQRLSAIVSMFQAAECE